jgi:hypothetical protein
MTTIAAAIQIGRLTRLYESRLYDEVACSIGA